MSGWTADPVRFPGAAGWRYMQGKQSAEVELIFDQGRAKEEPEDELDKEARELLW